MVDYSGPREAKGIVSWLEKKTGPPAVDVEDAAGVKALTDKEDVVVVGLFKNQKSDEAKEFIKTADKIDDMKFAITSSEALFKEYKIKSDNAVIVLKQFDEGRADYEGELKAKNIESFIKSESIRLVTEFSPQTAPKLFGTDVKVHMLFIADKEDEDTKEQLEAVTEVAKKNKGKMIFISVDSGSDDNKQVVEFFGLKAEDAPTYVIYEVCQRVTSFAHVLLYIEIDPRRITSAFSKYSMLTHLDGEKRQVCWR